MTDEGFEAFHVPQQSRRDKLRVVVVQSQYYAPSSNTTSCQEDHQPQPHHQAAASNINLHHHLLPTAALYDSSDLLPNTHMLRSCVTAGNPLVVGGGGGGGGGGNHHHHDANCKLQQAATLVCVSSSTSSAAVVKEEGLGLGVNFMAGFGGGGGGGGGLLMNSDITSSSSSSSHHRHHPPYSMDPHDRSSLSAVNLNPSSSSIQDMNNNVHNNDHHNHNHNPFDLYTSTSYHDDSRNPRDFDHHHQSLIDCGSGDHLHHRQVVSTTLFKPQTLSLTNYESRTNIVQAAGGLSLSLSSPPPPPPRSPHYNTPYTHPQNNNHQALELNNLMSPLRYNHQSSSSSIMFADDKTSIGEYVIRGGGGGGIDINVGGGGGGCGSASASASVSNNNLSRGAISTTSTRGPLPLGPFTGYALILKESRFLKPAQQLLGESCDINVGGGGGGGPSTTTGGIYYQHHHHVDDHRMMISSTGGGGGGGDSSISNLMDPHPNHQILDKLSGSGGTSGLVGGGDGLTTSSYRDMNLSSTTSSSDDQNQNQNHDHVHHHQTKKTRLIISMLDEVCMLALSLYFFFP